MIKIFFVIIAILTVIGTGCQQQATGPGRRSASFDVVLTIQNHADTVLVGKSIVLSAVLTDTTVRKKSPSLNDKEIVWQIVAGGGALSTDISNSVTYTAPDTIPSRRQNVTIRVFPKMDMRTDPNHMKYITLVVSKGILPIDTMVCFSRDILPLFLSNCTMSGCHNNTNGQHGYSFNTYSGIMRIINKSNPSRSKFFEVTNGYGEDRMPPYPKSPLPDTLKNLVLRWIIEGTPNTDCTSDPNIDCDTTNVKYSTTIKTILQFNCIGCHSGSQPQGGLDYTSYNNVVQNIQKLWGSINHLAGHQPMPDPNIKLTDCEISQFRIWIAQGTPNN